MKPHWIKRKMPQKFECNAPLTTLKDFKIGVK